jgi:radical SAM superfamily enzyme YgiQ (UPF0313 family)
MNAAVLSVTMNLPTVLLLIPPLTQLNTPYPSTAYLTGFLQSRGVPCEQADLGIEMVLHLFSREGLTAVFDQIMGQQHELPSEAQEMLTHAREYLDLIEPVIAFLQGRSPESAAAFARAGHLPRGPRFRMHQPLPRSTSRDDRAKHNATRFLEDLTDLVHATISSHFALSRYGEHLGRSASSFDSLLSGLSVPPTLTDRFMLQALFEHINRLKPGFIGLSVPFPGNLYGAFRIAQAIKQNYPDITVVLGGGYANTELRRINDPRVFDFVDFITLDDGERPLLSLIEYLSGQRSLQTLCRTFYRKEDRVLFANDLTAANFSMNDVGCPTYRGLQLDHYLSILDSTNPMHRLWSEGHWNKLTVAHGCYWKQCTFCDVGLDYIGRYEMTPTERLIQQIQQLIAETGRREFHFVDEAAPPAALKSLALALLEQNISISWWGNIRFEEAFTPDLCRLLAASGCIAVTAGLEAAADRLLIKMKKGITVDQTALVATAFRDAGILVHAYLMYGFPSETIRETIDSLERVRQLFAANVMQSAFWHRFTTTAHSPIGFNPKANGLQILGPQFGGFAENDLIHRDPVGPTPEWIGEGLRRSMLNYLEGRGLRMDVRRWFDRAVPQPRVARNWVSRILKSRHITADPNAERRLVWIGGRPVSERIGKRTRLHIPGQLKEIVLTLPSSQARWLLDLIEQSTPWSTGTASYPLVRETKTTFPSTERNFTAFVKSPVWNKVRSAGLVLV